MNPNNGYIYTPEQMEEFRKKAVNFTSNFVEMKVPPTEQQMARKPPKVGRNESCPCGSGRKFKRCCLK